MMRRLLAVFFVLAALGAASASDEPLPAWPDTLRVCGDGKPPRKPAPHLAALHEIELERVVCEPGRETYRATLVEFHHSQQFSAVRIEVWRNGRAAVTVKETESTFMPRREPRRLLIDRARMLTADELASFKTKFDASPFWTMEVWPRDMPCTPGGMVIVEAVRDGRYREVGRFCGFEEPAMVELLGVINGLYHSLKR
jgi:hypothetical protein